jgi:hypothetical protein
MMKKRALIVALLLWLFVSGQSIATVSTTIAENEHTGDGTTTLFPFTFRVFSGTDVKVLVDDEVISSGQYQVSINDSSGVGGTVLFTVAPANNAEILIQRAVPQTQQVAFPLQAKLNTKELEKTLDRNVAMVQDVKRDLDKRTFVWRSAWDAAHTYQPGDAVTHEGSTYFCVAENTTSEPPSADWEVLANKGETGDQGIPGMVWQGVWDSGTAYAINDVVERNGSSYIAIAGNTNDAPPSANWEVVAGGGNFPQISVDASDSPVTVVANRTYLVDTSAGDVTLTLPVSHLSSQGVKFKHKVGGNEMIINGGNIDACTEMRSTVEGQALRIESDGTDWMVF